MERGRGVHWHERAMEPGEIELLAALGGAPGPNPGGVPGQPPAAGGGESDPVARPTVEALGAIAPGDGLEGGDGPLGGLQETYLPPHFHATRRRRDEPRR